MAKKKRSKLTKAQAKELALRKKKQRQMTWALAGVGSVAVLIVLALIAMSGESGELVEPEHLLRDDVETGVTEEGYPYRGSSDAPVTIVEVSDYYCSVCAEYALEAAPLIDDELVATGQVKYVIHPFARVDASFPLVEAAACAQDQDGFWDFHHVVFTNQRRLPQRGEPSRTLLRRLAELSDLNVQEFESCLDEGRHEDQVLAATQSGREDLGVTGTPTFFVNGELTKLLINEAYVDTIRKAVVAAQAAVDEQE